MSSRARASGTGRTWRAALLAVVLGVSLSAPARAQEAVEVLEARVTAVSGGHVFLDVGRDDGVEVDDLVRIFPLGPVVGGKVSSVSRTNCRVTVRGDPKRIEVGARAEVVIPAGRKSEEEAPEPEAEEPTTEEEPITGAEGGVETRGEPVWSHPPEEWTEETPLLAPLPTRSEQGDERRIEGTLQTGMLYTEDRRGADQEFYSSNTQADLGMRSPFGAGGFLRVRTELIYRTSVLEDSPNEDELKFRPDRLSYRRGDAREGERSWQAGRFLHEEFAELGLLDGVEFGQELGPGRIGASVGFLPERTDDLTTGKDFETAIFYRYLPGEEDRFSLGAGYQKTWHEGEADRDLLITTLYYRPLDTLTFNGTAWIDFYTSKDKNKDSAVELTEFYLDGSYRFDGGHGMALFGSHLRWPDILRREFSGLTPEQIEDNHVSRVGMRGWGRVSEGVRVDGRVDYWTDQDDSGNRGEVGVSVRDKLYEGGDISLSVFRNEGSFSTGTGLRVRATKQTSKGYFSLAWDGTDYDQDNAFGPQAELFQQSVRGTWDTTFGTKWNLSLYAEERFGDEQDSFSIGFFLQRHL